MAKQSGMAWTTLAIDNSAGAAKDIRNDITNFQFATPRGVQDTTGIDKSAMERLLLLADFSITINGVYNPAADRAHQVLRTVSSASNLRTTTIAFGVSPALETLPIEAIYTDYQFTRAADGSATFSSPGVLADGTVPTWVTS
jgi:hypothetical protein